MAKALEFGMPPPTGEMNRAYPGVMQDPVRNEAYRRHMIAMLAAKSAEERARGIPGSSEIGSRPAGAR